MNPTEEKWWAAAATTLAALHLSWLIVVGTLFGAAATMILTSGDALRSRAANATLGILLSLVSTPAVGDYMEVKPLTNGVIAMVIALWGPAALREGNQWVKDGGLKSILSGLFSRLPKGGQ